MTKIDLPYVTGFFGPNRKKKYYRFRRKGYPQRMLRGEPGSSQFMADYAEALDAAPPAIGLKRTIPGSLSDALVRYYASADWRELSPQTQRQRRAILEHYRPKHGDKRIKLLQREHIVRFLDRLANQPHAANNHLKAWRGLMRFCFERNLIATDPTQGVRKRRTRSEGFHTWTADQIAAYEAHWPLGTRQRLALALLAYTGQRRSDVVRMGPQHITKDGALEVTQDKTGRKLTLPIVSPLREAIDATPAKGLAFLITEQGAPFTAAGFGNAFADWCKAAGLPDQCRAHGLRKAVATRLADAGLSASAIMAITGHRTLSEVQRYTEAADQKRLANKAAAALGGTQPEQKLSNPTGPECQTRSSRLKG
jgi:integrase